MRRQYQIILGFMIALLIADLIYPPTCVWLADLFKCFTIFALWMIWEISQPKPTYNGPPPPEHFNCRCLIWNPKWPQPLSPERLAEIQRDADPNAFRDQYMGGWIP